MPGREDLIKQNTARSETRARVENAGEQAPEGGEKPTYSSHRSLLGANLDVASALTSIEFALKGPLGDGALRNSVAYIRYWSRPGSKATAEAAAQTVDATQIDPAADSQAQIQQQIRENYLLPKTLVESSAAEYLSDTYAFRDIRANERVGDSFTSGKLGTEVGVQGDVIPDTGIDPNTGYRPSGSDSLYANGWDAQTIQVDSKPQKTRQDALSVEIPKINNEYTFSKTDLNTAKFDTSLNLDLGTTINPRTSGVGQLKPANPNGFVNAISRIGKSAPSGKPERIGYAGIAGPAEKGRATLAKSGTLAKGMWQFLFNPSELEIVAGPEFKVAETWGVSEKGNSGQPLNWSHNKNAELKFNSVLLNGYVFGRKVEELEQGIFELFMAREGGGQAGPPILEFVWGKRVFGPCVIKDISIKEKMWDEGEVVNAELSFVLEQIPEWTINDGYVDVARPGKIPMVYDATEPSGKVGAGTTAPGATSPSDTPPGGGAGSPGQKPATSAQPADFVACKNLRDLQLNAIAFNPAPGYYSPDLSGSLIPGIGSGLGQKGPYQSNFTKNLNTYKTFLGKGNSIGVSTSTKCTAATIMAEHSRLTKNANDSLKEVADKQMASIIKGCAAELGNKAGGFFDQKDCKRFFVNPKKPTTNERL